MFADAVEKVGSFTRPVFTIMRAYGSDEVVPAAGTMFFVNENCVAVTSKRVALLLKSAQDINAKYQEFLQEKKNLDRLPEGDRTRALEELEARYQYRDDTVVQIRHNFLDCAESFTGFRIHVHGTLDLAIIEFTGFKNPRYTGHALFKRSGSEIRQGQQLCRLGFAFPEFENYSYDPERDILSWTKGGHNYSPRFPLDGMVTRFLADQSGINGLELSTPGYKGHSGSPVFDRQGGICGMQAGNRHTHAGLDVENDTVRVKGRKKTVSNYPYVHFGQCVHEEAIKAFLREHKIKYYEEPIKGVKMADNNGKVSLPLS